MSCLGGHGVSNALSLSLCWSRCQAALRSENATQAVSLKQVRAAIARETSASAHAAQQIAKIHHESKDKRDELYQALNANELLRRERQERDDALEKVSQLALDYETALKVLHDQQRDYLEALDEMRIDNAQQRLRIEQLEHEKQHVEAKLVEMDEHESEVDVVVRELKMRHDMEKAVLRVELDELRKKAVEWKQKEKHRLEHVKVGSTGDATGNSGVNGGDLGIEELERQLEMVHELRVQKRQARARREGEREIQQLRSDVESLVEHQQDGGLETRRAVERALEVESRKHHTADQEEEQEVQEWNAK